MALKIKVYKNVKELVFRLNMQIYEKYFNK